jgi:hypothetical protein
MVTVLRPLSTSELLDRTFHLYKNNFLLFVGITAIPQLVIFLFRVFGAAIAASGQVTGVLVTIAIATFANLVAIEIAHAAVVIAVSDLHLDRTASIRSSYAAAKSSMLRVFGISLAIGIAVGVASVFLLIPGIYLALAWSLAIPVTVLEGGGLTASTTRSKELTKGTRWRIFVTYVLLIVLTILVSVIIDVPMEFLARVIARSNPSGTLALLQLTQGFANFLSTSLVGPLVTIALTLIYYDQRVRKEGFDLQLMMASLQPGSQPPAAAAATTN